jgi:hypothetical protein
VLWTDSRHYNRLLRVRVASRTRDLEGIRQCGCENPGRLLTGSGGIYHRWYGWFPPIEKSSCHLCWLLLLESGIAGLYGWVAIQFLLWYRCDWRFHYQST